MISLSAVRDVRNRLAPVGYSLPSVGLSAVPTAVAQRSAVRRLEEAGYRNAWANEGVGGKEVLVQIAILLSESEHTTFGTAVTPMWARPPMVLHAAAHQLAEAFPGRFVLGLGVGYDFMADMVGQDYGKPLATLLDYVQRMPEPTPIIDAPPVDYPTLIAANGPKSVAQAGRIADGAIPTMVPVDHVAAMRSILGPDKLIAVGLPTFVDDDVDAARTRASRTIATSLAVPNSPYAKLLGELGYTDDERATGATRLVDAITACGPAASIAAATRRYLDAGADHVLLQPITDTFDAGIDALEAAAPAVTGR
jgi:probable F420-dependent oxidoreductase